MKIQMSPCGNTFHLYYAPSSDWQKSAHEKDCWSEIMGWYFMTGSFMNNIYRAWVCDAQNGIGNDFYIQFSSCLELDMNYGNRMQKYQYKFEFKELKHLK